MGCGCEGCDCEGCEGCDCTLESDCDDTSTGRSGCDGAAEDTTRTVLLDTTEERADCVGTTDVSPTLRVTQKN